MSDHKIHKIVGVVDAGTGTLSMGGAPVSNSLHESPSWPYRQVWGIMVGSSTTGTISMSDGGGIDLSDLSTGVALNCAPMTISASAGIVYLLG